MQYSIKEELRKNYDVILMVTKFYKEEGKPSSMAMDLLKPYKARIRQMLKRLDEELDEEENGRTVKMTDEGSICYKWIFDCYSKDEFEVTKLMIKSNCWMSVNCPWDCSGQRFTAWMSFFYIPQENKMIWYHYTALDI